MTSEEALSAVREYAQTGSQHAFARIVRAHIDLVYGAALRQGDLDWLTFVNQTFTIAMFGHETALYDAAFKEYFGQEPPPRHPGFPII